MPWPSPTSTLALGPAVLPIQPQRPQGAALLLGELGHLVDLAPMQQQRAGEPRLADFDGMTVPPAAFARDPVTAAYYEQRAAEYDQWYYSQGRFAERDRPGWAAEVDQVVQLVVDLPVARTLDVACGSGFLTRHLRGDVVGLDQSPAMVEVARLRLPRGVTVVGDALVLPFVESAFDRVLTGHFYGHLPVDERAVFLAEVQRAARELIVIDSALRPGMEAEQWQQRVLNNGSRYQIYKRYLTAAQLAHEIGGEKLFDGRWFVAARTLWLAGARRTHSPTAPGATCSGGSPTAS